MQLFLETSLMLVSGLLPQAEPPASPAKAPIKVFILAGQSNMEGKAKVSLLEYQATHGKTVRRFAHLRDGEAWKVRDDVQIRFLDRKGALTVGFGSPGCIGPELEFGRVMGNHFDEPVLVIKAAWGGRSLYRDFRPPSAGLPDDAKIDALLAAEQKLKPDATRAEVIARFGRDYRLMLDEVKKGIDALPATFPGARDRGHEIAGFVWFQGWNDMIDDTATAQYATNLAHLIRDVRRDLGVADLPFVIGQFGVGGIDATDEKHLRFKAAQALVCELEEFKGNVALVKTDVFWDNDAQVVFDKGWRENPEEWAAVGSDYPYHYLGSVKTYCNIGEAFGIEVIKLRKGAVQAQAAKKEAPAETDR